MSNPYKDRVLLRNRAEVLELQLADLRRRLEEERTEAKAKLEEMTSQCETWKRKCEDISEKEYKAMGIVLVELDRVTQQRDSALAQVQTLTQKLKGAEQDCALLLEQRNASKDRELLIRRAVSATAKASVSKLRKIAEDKL